MIGSYRSITQIRCYDTPDHIFTEDPGDLSIADSIGCEMITYWKLHKAADDKAKVIVEVLVVIDEKAPKFLVEVNASDFFASELEDFCKKIIGPIKRGLCEKITEVAGDHKITNYTISITQKLD